MAQINSNRFQARMHLPRGSADASYQVVDTESDNEDVIALVDPNMTFDDPEALAHEIAEAMNASRVTANPFLKR